MNKLDKTLARYNIESEEKWKDYYKAMPQISLKEGFTFNVLPPFGGALMRFNIMYDRWNYSFYFDVNDALGLMGIPYWEMYGTLDYQFIINEDNEQELVENNDTLRYSEDEFKKMILDMYSTIENLKAFAEKHPEAFV